MTAHQEQETDSTARRAGLIIAVSAIASIAAVALDSGAQGSDPLAVLQSMVRIRDAHQQVHIVAMACLFWQMFGLTVLSQRLGLRRAPVLAGLIAYGAGSMLMLLATIIDGFISTDLAAHFVVAKSPEAVRAGYWMIQAVAGVALTDIARVAWVCQAVAAVAWSIALLGERGSRAFGIAGLVSGALPGVAVVAAGSNMTAPVVVGVLLVQAIWNLTVAGYLLRGAKPLLSVPAPYIPGTSP